MSSSLKITFEDMASEFYTTMAKFQKELDERKGSPSVSVSLDSLAADFAAFKEHMTKSLSGVLRQVQWLTGECDRLEMAGRRNMLLFHGVPEADREDPEDVVVAAVAEHLPSCKLSDQHIARSHRMGRPSKDPKKPRPLVVKFFDRSLRDQIWFAKTGFKGTGITVSEFLSKTRHNAFMEARKKFGMSKCWTAGGLVIVLGPGDKKHKITTVAELDTLSIPQADPAGSKGGASGVVNPSETLERRKRNPTRK